MNLEFCVNIGPGKITCWLRALYMPLPDPLMIYCHYDHREHVLMRLRWKCREIEFLYVCMVDSLVVFSHNGEQSSLIICSVDFATFVQRRHSPITTWTPVSRAATSHQTADVPEVWDMRRGLTSVTTLTHWGRDKMTTILQKTFGIHFLLWKLTNVAYNFTEICSRWPNRQ